MTGDSMDIFRISNDATAILAWARGEHSSQLKMVLEHPDFKYDFAVKTAAKEELRRRGEEQ